MADLVIGTISVAPTTQGEALVGTAGGTITPCQPLYRDATNNTLKPADANIALGAEARVIGVSITGAASGDRVYYFSSLLDVNPGVAVVQAETYILSANVGKICPLADLASGSYLTYLFFGLSTTVLRMMLRVTDIQKP